VALNRMVEVCKVSFPTLYDKIDFIHRQCTLFAASREARLPGMDLGTRFLCTDRQDYMVNWGDRKARNTIQLTAVATADRASSYIFGFAANYDPTMSLDEADGLAATEGDAAKAPAMRTTARVWTTTDYESSLQRAAARQPGEPLTARDDLDAPELIDAGQQLPRRGVQVHADYLVHGRFHLLRHLLRSTSRLNFAMN
jgi:hypothetical protein